MTNRQAGDKHLGSLLVRDGVVSVDAYQNCLTRETIDGGEIDTLLLEERAISHRLLRKYLSRLSGFPSFDMDTFIPPALPAYGIERANKFNAIPFAVDGNALRVAVRMDAGMDDVRALADEMQRAIQPFVALTCDYYFAKSAVYGTELPLRYERLVKRGTTAPSVIVDDSALAIPSKKRRMRTTPGIAPAAEYAKSRDTIQGMPPQDKPPATQDQRPTRDIKRPRTDPEGQLPKPPAAAFAHEITAREGQLPQPAPHAIENDVTEPIPPHSKATQVVMERPPHSVQQSAPPPAQHAHQRQDLEAVAEDHGDSMPWDLPPPLEQASFGQQELQSATLALAECADRDAMFGVLVQGLRYCYDFTVLLFTQKDEAMVRGVWGPDGSTSSPLGRLAISSQPTLRAVRDSRSTYSGPVHFSGEIDPLRVLFRDQVPEVISCFPVLLGQRVVAIALGYSLEHQVDARPVALLDTLARRLGNQLKRLIFERRSGTSPIVAPQPIEPTAEASQPIPIDEMPPVSVPAPEPQVDVLKFLEDFLATNPDRAESMLKEAGDVLGENLHLLWEKFPGPTWTVSESDLTRASDRGPLLKLVVHLGSRSVPMLIEKMNDRRRAVRFYATLCAAQIRFSDLLAPLGMRVFDDDWQVRALALTGLAGYPRAELELVLRRIRERVSSGGLVDSERGAEAMIALTDREGIPHLTDALEQNQHAIQVRQALKTLAKQDFATVREWRRWWDDNESQHVILWLIEGLKHSDVDIRRSSAEDLREISGQYFEFHHDLSKEQREAAIARWEKWYEEIGHAYA